MKQGTKTITFRVSEDVYSEIVDTAKQEERSINNFITYVIKEYLKNQNSGQKNKDREESLSLKLIYFHFPFAL